MKYNKYYFYFIALFLVVPTLYAQSNNTLNLSTDLVSLGVANSNMVPNQTMLDSTPLFEAGIKYAASHKITTITANTGAYYFLSTSGVSSLYNVAISGIGYAMTIDLQGSDLYFGNNALGGMVIQSVTGGITLQNFTLDYLHVPYTQINITSVSASQRQIQYTVQSGWGSASSLNYLYPLINSSGAAITSLLVFRNGQPIIDLLGQIAQPLTDGVITVNSSTPIAQLSQIQAGDSAVLYMRGNLGVGLFANRITGCTLNNIKIFSGCVGFRSVNQSSTLLQRIEVIPRPGTNRLIGSYADGIDPAMSGPNNTVRLCRVIRSTDDGFAPNTFFFGSVSSILGTNTVQVQGDTLSLFNNKFSLPNGSNVAFQSSIDGSILGSAVVVSQATATPINGLSQLSLVFDKNVPSTAINSWIYSTDAETKLGSGLRFERNTVQNQNFAIGFDLWGLTNATIYGNYIYRSAWSAITAQNGFESNTWIVPPTVNMTLTNNVINFSDTQYLDSNWLRYQLGAIQVSTFLSDGTLATQSPNQNISISNNFISNPNRSALWIGNTNGGSVVSNYLFNPNNNPNPANSSPNIQASKFATQALQPIVTASIQNFSLSNNNIDQASLQAYVTDLSFSELAAYAPSSMIRMNAYNLGTLDSPQITLKDADGKMWTLSVISKTSHSVDLQLPSGVSLGGSVLTLTSGIYNYFSTLFIDSQDNIPAINQGTYLISPSTNYVPASGGNISFLVVTQPGNTYSATDSDSFVNIISPGGSSTGVITLTLSQNTGSLRTTSVNIAGQLFVITQSGLNDPVIIVQPKSQFVASGGTANFSITTSGATKYQWYLNGNAIAGANSSNISIVNANDSSVGTYTVVASGNGSNTTSSGAYLKVYSVPVIVSQSATTNYSKGAPFVITVSNPNISTSYQWYLNGSAISGASSSTYSVASAQPSDAGVYYVSAISGSGKAQSDPVPISVTTVSSGSPVIVNQPSPISIASGSTSVFRAGVSPSATYQWYFNGAALLGATSPELIIPNTGNVNVGNYNCVASNALGSVTTATAQLSLSTTTNPGRLVNLSVLTMDGPGSQMLTLGFVNGGAGTTGSEPLLIRASGPALTAFNVPTVLADPTLKVLQGTNVVVSNDNWGSSSANINAVNAAEAATGAFALTPTTSLDAAVVQALPSVTGGYTVQVLGNGSGVGNALAEVYDNTANYTTTSPRLINLSCLQQVPTNGMLSAGFAISGTTAKTVLIRVSGPTLGSYGVPGTMTDPQLNVFSGTTVIASNAGWAGDTSITAANSATGAFQFASASSKDSAVVMTLAPGAYSVQATSISGSAGAAMIEVYEVQ